MNSEADVSITMTSFRSVSIRCRSLNVWHVLQPLAFSFSIKLGLWRGPFPWLLFFNSASSTQKAAGGGGLECFYTGLCHVCYDVSYVRSGRGSSACQVILLWLLGTVTTYFLPFCFFPLCLITLRDRFRVTNYPGFCPGHRIFSIKIWRALGGLGWIGHSSSQLKLLSNSQ